MDILKFVEALEKTSREILTYEVNCEYSEAINEAVSLLVKQGERIAELEAQTQWIPVTERMPESIGLFLVIEKHWLDGSPCRRIAKWNTVDWFTADRKSREITPRVTHWMPLPELPKEDGHD